MRQSHRKGSVDQHDKKRYVQLNRSGLETSRTNDALVEHDQRSVKQRRCNRRQQTFDAHAAKRDTAADAPQTDRNNRHGGKLSCSQTLPKQQR